MPHRRSAPGDEIIVSDRYLKSDYDDGFIRYSRAIPIIEKVASRKEQPFSSIVSPQNPFGFNTAVKGSSTKTADSVIIISKGKTDLQELYINRKEVTLHPEWIDQYKILTSKAAEGGVLPGKVIAKMHIVGPGKCCNGTYMVIGPFGDSLETCENVRSYMRTRLFRFLVGIKKPTQDLKDMSFSLVPMQDWSKPWSDEELYHKYNLSKEEIAYIESMIRPMEAEALFDSGEMINPDFGNFNLEEHGVKVGDRIIYTPTGTELTVAEDNMVECNGEMYTLAQFTAEYMPRNKRSVSGVCQGPKYFTYNGISLYKLKESFLGGQR